MNILKKIGYKMIGEDTSENKTDVGDWMNIMGLGSTNKDELSEATYYTCLKILSEAIGKLPIKLQGYSAQNGIIAMTKDPLYNKVRLRPNPYMTSTVFWSTVEFNRNHFGNAYVLIDGADKNTNLWILPSDRVKVIYDNKKILGDRVKLYYQYNSSDKTIMLDNEQVLHFKTFNTLDGIVGKSVKEQLLETVQSGNKSQDLINKMYDSGFTAKAVLQYTADLSDANERKLIKGIERYARGNLKSDGIENIIPIPAGTTLTPLNIKLADNQFIDIKKYSALQVASAFGVKPYHIGNYDKSSYSSSEAQQLSFYVDTLLYIVKQYEEEMTFKLLTDSKLKSGMHFKFNISSILRADHETQIRTLSQAVSNFVYTPNEARQYLDLEAKEGGDQLVGNGASIPITLVGSQYTDEELERG